jgi:hypothetical protein
MISERYHQDRSELRSAVRRIIAGAILAPAALTVGIGIIVAAPSAHADIVVSTDPEKDYARCISNGESKADCCYWSGGIWMRGGWCTWLEDTPSTPTNPSRGATTAPRPGVSTRTTLQ